MTLLGGNVFLLMVNGQIENLEFPQYDDIYCRFQYVFGQDWDIASGIEEGLTQTVKRGLDDNQIFTLNFPIDVGFKSTNPYGWPRLIIQAYGYDLFGKDVVRGYGMVHIPITPGRHEKTISLFVPEPSSQIQQFFGWMTSRQPELINPRTVAEGDGREVTRMRSQGKAKIVFNTVTKDLKQMGYSNSSELMLHTSKMSIG